MVIISLFLYKYSFIGFVTLVPSLRVDTLVFCAFIASCVCFSGTVSSRPLKGGSTAALLHPPLYCLTDVDDGVQLPEIVINHSADDDDDNNGAFLTRSHPLQTFLVRTNIMHPSIRHIEIWI